MKKQYIKPSVIEVTLGTMQMLAASGVKGNNGIGYGGKDDGSHDPSARRYRGFEDDDEEDEDY